MKLHNTEIVKINNNLNLVTKENVTFTTKEPFSKIVAKAVMADYEKRKNEGKG